jgi:uncharacterized protein YjdB
LLRGFARLFAAVLALVVVVAGVSVSLSCAVPVPPTLDLTPSSQVLVSRQALQLTVTRRFTGGPVDDVTSRVSYVSTNNAIATISERGVVTAGDQPGSVVVKAYDDASDATALASFTVVAAQITSIELSPSPAKVLARGASESFTATAHFNNGAIADVTSTVSWSSTNESVALVGNTQFDKGVVRAVASGDTTILATDGLTLVQGRSIVFVPEEAATLEAIVVTPDPGSVSLGKTTPFRADGLYSDRTTKDLSRAVTWSSSRPDLASVDTVGVVTGVALGDVTITAVGPAPFTKVRGSVAAKVIP